jgi:uncharacterized membrane protein YfcA
MFPELGVLQMTAAALAIAASAFVQASVGFGYALIAAPVLALISDRLVPGPVMLSSLLLSAATGFRERHAVDRRGVGVALAGRLPGVLAAGAVAVALPGEASNLLFGALVLLAAAISASGLRPKMTTPILLLAGFSSGLMGTLTAIGGPPMALVYQHADGPTLRASLNSYFAVGSLMSICVLWWAGHFGVREALLGLALLPAVAVGFAASGVMRRAIDRGYTRRAVLTVASASAIAVIVKTLL